MSGEILTRRKLLAVEIETTPGTQETALDADAAFNVFDLKLNPTIPFAPRDGQGGFSQLAQVGGPRMGTAEFTTQLIGGATLPFWAQRLLPACGWVESARIYSPVLAPPGTAGVKTVTLSSYENGVLKKLFGAMGNPVFEFVAGEVVTIKWRFVGKWEKTVTDTSPLAPTFPLAEAPSLLRFVNAGMTIGAWSPKMSRMTIDGGNNLVMVENGNHADETGYAHAIVSGRRVNGKIDPQATLVATKNLYGDWLELVESAFEFGLAEATANGVLFASPKFQVVNAQLGERQGVQTDDIEFQLNPSSVTAGVGNELTIEFDTA